MKLFLGASLPREARSAITSSYQSLRQEYPYFNWIAEDQYHVTVAQLGERSPEKMPLIDEAIQQSIFDIRPTRLFGLETALFQEDGVVIYLAYARNKEFETIRERVIDVFQVPYENKVITSYAPRTILATYKLPSKQQYLHLKKKLAHLTCNVEFEVSELHLFETITKTTNPEYEILHTFELVE
ncbi:hypothetical protein KBD81_04315 [Candidatus Woesebacteria bacterium]|nr:hypothetical protein [Candidatus Woesebacteria bacterium]